MKSALSEKMRVSGAGFISRSGVYHLERGLSVLERGLLGSGAGFIRLWSGVYLINPAPESRFFLVKTNEKIIN